MLEYINFIILQIVSKIGKFFIEIIPSFLLPSQEYGEFSYLYSLIIVLSSLGVLGLHTSLLRLVNEKYQNLFSIVINIQIISFFILFITSILFVKNNYLFIFIFITFGFSLLQTFSTFFRATQQIKKWFFYREVIVFSIMTLILSVFYFLEIELNIKYLLFILLAVVMISVLLMFIHLNKFFKFKIENLFSLKKETIEILKISIPMFFTGFTYLLLSRLDVIMLNSYISEDLLGNYNIIARVSFQVLFFWQVVSAYFMPKIAKFFANNDLYNIKKYHKRYLFLSIVLTLFLSLFLSLFINFVDMKNYIHNWNSNLEQTMYLILIGQFVSVVFSSYGYFILYIHKEKLAYINSIFMLIFAVTFNLIFIPLYGIKGAAFANICSVLLFNLIELFEIYYYKKTLYL